MTIDEAIKHAKEVAEENEKSLRGWKECINRGTVGWLDFDKEKVDTSITRCSKCAEEHRQLAEWLRELKQLREQSKWIPVSESLPKADEYVGDVARYYLVQDEFGDMMVARYRHSEYWQQINQLKPIGDEIVAWMPLPPCYKPQEGSNKE